jgi:hypothetical protein
VVTNRQGIGSAIMVSRRRKSVKMVADHGGFTGGHGFLTGKADENTMFDSSDIRNRIPRFTSEARKANQAMVEPLLKT